MDPILYIAIFSSAQHFYYNFLSIGIEVQSLALHQQSSGNLSAEGTLFEIE